MKRILILSIVALCAYAGWIAIRAMPARPITEVQAAQLPTEYHTPTFIPTETPIPSPTIGYEATLWIAQATADEARRVNAQVTAQAEQNQIAIMQMTAAQDQRNQEMLSWTAQAANTVIPLTATMQAVSNTLIAESQNLMGAQMTATYQAPTQMAAIMDLQNAAQYAWLNNTVNIFGKAALGLFCLALSVFLFRWKPTPRAEVDPIEQPTETTVWVKSTADKGASSKRFVIPCSPQQLTELAEHITQGTKTLAINQWEGKDTQFTRAIIHQVRAWLQENKFAVGTPDGQLVPTNDGMDFLNGWLNTSALPTEYGFAEEQEKEIA